MGSGRMTVASVMNPDFSSSWEKASEDLTQFVQMGFLTCVCPPCLPPGGLRLQVPGAGRECP